HSCVPDKDIERCAGASSAALNVVRTTAPPFPSLVSQHASSTCDARAPFQGAIADFR
ncbi:hypothetical protein K523DRAFT_120916, partial [Schizophyllum commune Tattone D]